MIRHHIIDKFGHSLYTQKRERQEELEDDNDEEDTKRFRVASDYETARQPVTKGYLNRYYVNKLDLKSVEEKLVNIDEKLDKLKELSDQFSTLTQNLKSSNDGLEEAVEEVKKSISPPEGCCFDAKNRRITNVAKGINKDDVSTVSQTLTYDQEKDIFKCGDKEFDLVVNNPLNPVIIAKDSSISGFAAYRGEDYKFHTHVYRVKDRLITYKGSKFVWNEEERMIKPEYDGHQPKNLSKFYSEPSISN